MDVNLSHVVSYSRLGNGIAASSNVVAGDVVIRINDPYLIIPENAALDIVCSYCLYQKPSLKRCTGCGVVRYCSTKCQALAWKSVHKEECRILKRLPAVPPTTVRALIDLVVRRELNPTASPRWAGLEGHAASLQKEKRWDEIVLQAKAAVEFTKSPVTYIEAVINVICRMATNAFRVTLTDNVPIGMCFEPVMSLANHSCTPNATIRFDGRKIELRALNDITKDEQIFISYIDPTQPKEIRQAELKARYFFTCGCEKCVQDDNAYATFIKSRPAPFPQLDPFVNPEMLTKVAELRCQESCPSSTSSRVQALLKASETTTSVPQRISHLKNALTLLPSQISAISPYPDILQNLYLSYLDTSNYVPALVLLLYTYLNCDVYLYPQPHHPVRVTRLATISRLLKQVASIQDDDRELMRGIESIPRLQSLIVSIDFITAVHVLLLVVRALETKGQTAETMISRAAEEELREVEDVQRQRGKVGQRLSEWIVDDNVEGREYSKKIFEGLRQLSALAIEIVTS